MKCPKDKATGYTAVIVVCAIVLSVVITAVMGSVAGLGMVGAGVLGSSANRGGGEVQFDKNSTLGKLQALGKQAEESARKMDAAGRSGDSSAQAAAALEGLGTLLGGGKHVDPIGIDQLKRFVPETFAGLSKKTSNAEKSGIASLMVSKAEATYSDDAQKRYARRSRTPVGPAVWSD